MSAIEIASRTIGSGHPVFVVAELSGNHHRNYSTAARLVQAAKHAGADAIKTQCFTPDSMTLKSDAEPFRICWNGQDRTLYDLYTETAMPLDWHPKLKDLAESYGMIYFASAFDFAGVDFCEQLGMPAYKIASFELVDIPLIRYAASMRKPLILSAGMATKLEIYQALLAASAASGRALLHCVSAYPAKAAEYNLRRVNHGFAAVSGISDHTLDPAIPPAAVALGACIVEKHLTLCRADGGPDAAFSLEPHEFAAMVESVRTIEQALGGKECGPTESEKPMLQYRRSLFVVRDAAAGEKFTAENIRSIRPAAGLAPKYCGNILGRSATRDCAAGEPLTWEMVKA